MLDVKIGIFLALQGYGMQASFLQKKTLMTRGLERSSGVKTREKNLDGPKTLRIMFSVTGGGVFR